jgi:hypothetical protein
MSPIVALKSGIRILLVGDAPLAGLLGGPKVHDEVPRGQETPYIAFGEAASRDNGTVSDAGHVTDLVLNVWSRQGGTREALIIADRAAQLIEDADLALEGHRLINARVTTTEIRRQPEKDLTRASLRLRLVTEVI